MRARLPGEMLDLVRQLRRLMAQHHVVASLLQQEWHPEAHVELVEAGRKMRVTSLTSTSRLLALLQHLEEDPLYCSVTARAENPEMSTLPKKKKKVASQ